MTEIIMKLLTRINPDIDVHADESLVADAILDSLQIMQLIVGISETFQIEIDPDDITAENFNSVNSIVGLVQNYMRE